MKVQLTAEAERDLESIADRIAEDNPQRAISFIGELRDSCLGLARFPKRFPWCRATNATASDIGCTAII